MAKKTYLGLRPGKILFGVIAFVAVTICGFLSSQPFYEIMISGLSIITIIYVIEGKLAGCVLGIIYCSAYAFVCYSRELYGLMALQVLVCAPAYAAGLVNWKKNQNKQNDTVIVKRLSKLKLFLVIITLCAGYWGVFALLKIAGSANVPVDSLTVVFGISGMTMLALRYVEQWYFHIAANISIVIIWAVKLTESMSNLNFMIAAIIFVFSNILGLISWLRMAKQNQK